MVVLNLISRELLKVPLTGEANKIFKIVSYFFHTDYDDFNNVVARYFTVNKLGRIFRIFIIRFLFCNRIILI